MYIYTRIIPKWIQALTLCHTNHLLDHVGSGRCRHRCTTSPVSCLWSTDIYQVVSSTGQHYRGFQHSPTQGLLSLVLSSVRFKYKFLSHKIMTYTDKHDWAHNQAEMRLAVHQPFWSETSRRKEGERGKGLVGRETGEEARGSSTQE
jgi:hypothetical protein